MVTETCQKNYRALAISKVTSCPLLPHIGNKYICPLMEQISARDMLYLHVSPNRVHSDNFRPFDLLASRKKKRTQGQLDGPLCDKLRTLQGPVTFYHLHSFFTFSAPASIWELTRLQPSHAWLPGRPLSSRSC